MTAIDRAEIARPPLLQLVSHHIIESVPKRKKLTNTHPGMSILLLTPKLNGCDGISMVSRAALAALQQSGNGRFIEIRSLAPDAFTPDQLASCACRSAQNSKLKYVGWSLQSLLRGLQFDLVIAMHIHLAPIAIVRTMMGSRLVVFLHGVEAWKPLTRLESLALRRASLVLANSHYTLERFKQVNSEHQDCKIQVCPLGVPTIEASPDGRDDRYALIVGRMALGHQYKGHDLLLELWGKVQEHAPGFRLLVAGDGDDRPRLQQKANSLGLQGQVEFLGLVDDRRLLQLYQNCSFFIMPSTGEGFGLVFLEAMRAGKACIAGVGAASEVVADGVSGLIVNPGSRKQVLDAILQLIRNPERTRRMGCAGYDRFIRLFTAEAFSRCFTQALNIQGNRGRRCAE